MFPAASKDANSGNASLDCVQKQMAHSHVKNSNNILNCFPFLHVATSLYLFDAELKET